MDTPNMASRIERAIKDAGFSYQGLADKTGLSRSSLQRYASGTTPKVPLEAVEKIADACGVTAEYLMGWDAPESWFEAKRLNEKIAETVAYMRGRPAFVDYCLESSKFSEKTRKRLLEFEPLLSGQSEEQYERMLMISSQLSKLSEEQQKSVLGLLTTFLR